ncbi:MAG: hypothetical protein J0M02_14335 [Planctomycetes bacterium]|nr:hypothetical protein [Planctomycetota bacterium]
MRNLPVSRPGSFLPVYSIGLALLCMWLVHLLHRGGRTWLIWDSAHPLRGVPLILAVLLGLGAVALWIAAWIALRRGRVRVNRTACTIAAITSLVVLYLLLKLCGYWLGFL